MGKSSRKKKQRKQHPRKQPAQAGIRDRLPQLIAATYLLALPFVVSIVGLDTFRLPKSAFSAISIIILTLVCFFLGKLKLKMHWASWESLLFVCVVYVGLHSAVSGMPRESLQGFVFLVLFCLLFLCLKSILNPPLQVLLWLGIGGVLAINAVLTVFQYYGWFEVMTNAAGVVLSGRLNPAGFIGEVNSGGFLFGLISLMLIYHIFVDDRRVVRGLSILLLLCNLLGLAYSRTLTASIALASCAGLWLVFHHWWVLSRHRKVTRGLVTLWGLLLVSLAIGSAVGYKSGLFGRVETVARLAREGQWLFVTAGRQPVYQLTWEMIKEEPWLGRGLNTFGRDFFSFRVETEVGQSVRLLSQPGAFREVHNEYLQVWEELGLLGLAGFVVLLFWPVIRAVRMIRGHPDAKMAYWAMMQAIGLVFVGISSLAFFPFHLAVTAAYVVLLLAGLRYFQGSGDTGSTGGSNLQLPSWLTTAAPVLLVCFSLFVGFQEIQRWRANRAIGLAAYLLEKASSETFRADQQRLMADEALNRLDRAEEMDPGYHTIHNLRGSAFLLTGRYEQAVRSYTEASRSIPSPEVFTNLAAAHIAREDFSAAEESVQLALRYDPEFGKALYALAYIRERRQ
jgi:O-antigen ligase